MWGARVKPRCSGPRVLHLLIRVMLLAEVLDIVPKQRVLKLESNQSSSMVTKAAKGPTERWNLIRNGVKNLAPYKVLEEFGISISGEALEVWIPLIFMLNHSDMHLALVQGKAFGTRPHMCLHSSS